MSTNEDCFLIVKDCSASSSSSSSKKFKVKFRSREEFFSVTVSKLRRAISSVLDKIDSHHNNQNNLPFSLEFEYEEENCALGIINHKTTRLPEGQLAEHALIADWGLRPGHVVSLIVPVPRNQQQYHNFERIENLDESTGYTTSSSAQYKTTILDEYDNKYDNNRNSKPAANLLVDSSVVSSLAKISAIDEEQQLFPNQRLLPPAAVLHSTNVNNKNHNNINLYHRDNHDYTENNNTTTTNNNNNNITLMATSKELRERLKNQQTTFFLSDNLTPAQKELQLKWMKDLEGGGDDETNNTASAFPDLLTSSRSNNGKNGASGLPPVYGSSSQKRSCSTAENDDQEMNSNIKRGASSTNNPDHFKELLEYSASRRREAKKVMMIDDDDYQKQQREFSPVSVASTTVPSPVSHQHQSKKNSVPLASSSSSSSSSESDENDLNENNSDHQKLTLAIRDADRRENIRLKEQLTLLSAELDVVRDQANMNSETLDRKLQQVFSRASSSYHPPEQRKALADAIMNTELLQKKLRRQEKELEKTKHALEEEKRIRRSMQRDLELLRGNIRVIVRIRGGAGTQHQDNNNNNNGNVVNINSDRTMISLDRGLLKPRGEFEFYKVLPSETSQSDFFDLEVAPLVDVCFASKRNLSLILSGQTSAGKTFTAFGPSASNRNRSKSFQSRNNFFFSGDENNEHEQLLLFDEQQDKQHGVVFRTAKMLLKLVDDANKEGERRRKHHHLRNNNDNQLPAVVGYQVGLSVIELYCDEIRDLLAGVPNQKQQQQQQELLMDHQTSSPSSNVVIFRSQEEANDLITRCASQRWTESTASNSHSSRSHCLLTFSVFSSSSASSSYCSSKIVIADLAGSERLNRSGSTGQRLVEAQFINKSLSALGDVVHALTSSSSSSSSSSSFQNQQQVISRAKNKTFVPWRNSSLTQLLQGSMNGDATTLFIACVVDDENHVEETHSTLTFASRVRCIKNSTSSSQNNIRSSTPRSNTHNIASSSRPISPSASKQNSRNTSRSSSVVSSKQSHAHSNYHNENTAAAVSCAVPLHQGGFSKGIVPMKRKTTTTGESMKKDLLDQAEVDDDDEIPQKTSKVDSENNNENVKERLRYQPRQALSMKSENLRQQHHRDPSTLKQESALIATTSISLLQEEKRKIDFEAIQASGHLNARETARLRSLLFKK